MTRDRWKSTASRVVLAATLAAAYVCAPVAMDSSGDEPLKVSSAAAQLAGGGDGDTSGSDEGGVGADVGAEVGGVGASVGAEVGSGGVSAGAGAEVGGGGGVSADVGAEAGGGGADVGADVGAGGDNAGGDSGGGGNAGGDSGSGDSNGSGNAGGDSGSGGNNGGDSGGGSSSGGDAGEGAGDGAAGGAGSQGTENAADPSAGEADAADTGRGDHPGIRSGPTPLSYFATLNVETPAFERYSNAVERNDLEAAGLALSAATNRPVTRDLVAYVNDELDVRTALTTGQIAAAANGVPVRSDSDAVSSAAGRLAEDAPR